MEQKELAALLARTAGGAWRIEPLAASGFCETWSARSGVERLFLKSAAGAAAGMLAAEADGLAALQATATVRVPRVVASVAHGSARMLALEWLEFAPPDAGF